MSKALKSFLVIFILLGGVYLGRKHLFDDGTVPLTPRPTPGVVSTPVETSRVTTQVFFPLSDLSATASFTVELPDRRGRLKDWVQALLSALSMAPSSTSVAVFPTDLVLRSVFLDERGTLYLDFPSAFLKSNVTGVELETLAIRAVLETIGRNIPSVERVKFLVDGTDAQTLWGHVYLRLPVSIPRGATDSGEP